MIVVAALYKFTDLPDFKELQDPLKQCCIKNSIKGTLLLAAEGINGTIAGSRQGIDAILAFLKKDSRFKDLECKESYANTMPFYRMKVRLKKEIVTLGIPEINPAKQAGTYINPEDWNDLINNPDIIILDTRNHYEVAIGTFKGAMNPKTTSFRQFPEFVKQNLDPTKHKKVAMFCTGGIRCEKASSYMLSQGFENVYHLKGGILKYLETVQEADSLWQGECFVFDNRVAIEHGLNEGTFEMCHGCRHPIAEKDKSSPHYEEGVSCPYCFEHLTETKRKRASDRHHQVKLAEKRGQQHLGTAME